MSIYKRQNSRFWWYAVRNGEKYIRGSTGTDDEELAKSVEQTIRTARTGKSPASRLHAVIDALLGSPKPVGVLLAGVWPTYSHYIRQTGGEIVVGTERQRRRICERFADWAKKSRSKVECAEDVDRECAAAFGEYLAKTKVTAKTRANLISDLATVWRGLQCVRNSIKENPWPLIVPSVKGGVRGKSFSPEQEKSVIESADAAGHGWGLACRIARYTGLRYGDVARLEWSSVNLSDDLITLKPSKTERRGIAVRIPIAAPLHMALAAVKAENGSQYVLPEHAECYPRPERGSPRPFSEAVLEKAGLADAGFTFHSWRHTFRTRLSEAGVSDEIAKRLGGWTVDKTAMRYDHDGRISELKKAVEKASS